jgi:hypothetical protein
MALSKYDSTSPGVFVSSDRAFPSVASRLPLYRRLSCLKAAGRQIRRHGTEQAVLLARISRLLRGPRDALRDACWASVARGLARRAYQAGKAVRA